MLRLLPGLAILVLWLYCLVDAIGAPESRVRNLPKVAWVFIVLLFPVVGSIAWLAVGRPERDRPLTRQQGAAPSFPEYERPGRFAATDPEKDEEFLRKIRERAEEQRRAYEQRKRREQETGTEPDAEPEAT